MDVQTKCSMPQMLPKDRWPMLFNIKKLDNTVFSSPAISVFEMQGFSWEHSPPTNVGWFQIPASTRWRVGSLLCSERFFFAYSGFPLSSETFLNSNVTRNGSEESLRGFASSRSLFISIFIYLFLFLYVSLSVTKLLVEAALILLNPFLSFLITEHMKVLLKDRCETKPLMCCIE